MSRSSIVTISPLFDANIVILNGKVVRVAQRLASPHQRRPLGELDALHERFDCRAPPGKITSTPRSAPPKEAAAAATTSWFAETVSVHSPLLDQDSEASRRFDPIGTTMRLVFV